MSLSKKTAAGSAWLVTAALFNNLSTFVVFIALARLLTPSQFGIVAFATVFVEFSRIVVFAGIPEALIKRAEWSERVASTAFWINLSISVMVAILLSALIGPLMRADYGQDFIPVLAALSLILVVEGASAVHVAKMRRDFKFKELAKRQMATNVLSGMLGVFLAYRGWGVWALVISRLAGVGGASGILWYYSGFRPRLTFSKDDAHEFSKFSMHQLGSQVLSQFGTQAPAFLIGFVAGPAAIANYRIGSRSIALILSVVVLPIQTAAISALSRLNDRGEGLAAPYLRLSRACAVLAYPVFFGIAAVAPDLVQAAFGSQWTDAGYVLIALALAGGPTVLAFFEGPVMSASGRSDLTFLNSFAAAMGNIVASCLAVAFGPVAVAAAMALRAHLSLPVSLTWVNRAIGVRPWTALRGVAAAYLCAAAMAAIVTAVRIFALEDWSSPARLIVCMALGGLLYLLFMLVLARAFVKQVIKDVAPLMPHFVGRMLLKL